MPDDGTGWTEESSEKEVKIFLDVDGILANFVASALEVHGCEDPWSSNPENLGSYDIIKLLNLEERIFWSPFDHHFWAGLKPLDDGFQLLRTLEKKHDIYLSTSPALAPGCSSGKHEWVNKHLPEYWYKLFIGPAKHVFAEIPGAVLIDDSDANVDKFRRVGGKAILYPQPWNSAHIYMSEREPYIAQQLYGDSLY